MSSDESSLPVPRPDDNVPPDLFELPDNEELEQEDLQLAAGYIADRQAAAAERFQQAWDRANLGEAQAALRDLHAWRSCQRLLARAEKRPLTIHLDSLLLSDCYQTLFDDPSAETVVYLTGIQLAPGEVTINRHIRLDHETQSAVRAAGDPGASFSTLRMLDECGHLFLGHCHNHTHSGENGLTPSEVDRDYQDRLESGPYTALGIIMTEDGYVRLFTNDLDTDVTIHGTHVERLGDDRLFLEEPARDASERLDGTQTSDDDDSHPGDGHQRDRPAGTDRRLRSDGTGRGSRASRWRWWDWW